MSDELTKELIAALKAQTEALNQQTIAISQLVNSNLDIMDHLMAADAEENTDSVYLDEPDTL
ncbi:hypothetical protein [Shewanella sp.]|jgi:hypothetical protein|uniref:hypothetical protein n=1 Tax=Shewanella sp. TaxID=50422 RepID=UPI0040471F38